MKDILKEKINSYKKKAIETAIAQADNPWIITTDADCIVPPKWLFQIRIRLTFNASLRKKTKTFTALFLLTGNS